MGVLKSILLIVYLVPFGANAQFRIVGLLNVDDPKTDGNKVSVYQSNAQGRGFSVDDGLKKFLIRPKNIIRVRIIDDIHQSVLIPETDNILMIRKQKPKVQRPTESFRHETIAVKKKPPKPVKIPYQPKRPSYQQQIVTQFNKSKYQHKFNNLIPDTVNRSPAFNPPQSKQRKAMKHNGYQTRCRCEKDPNCPRIQISVSRCEPDYFLCC